MTRAYFNPWAQFVSMSIKKRGHGISRAPFDRKSGKATFSNQDTHRPALDFLRKSRAGLCEKCHFRRTCRRK